jgi:glucuronate isomerase
MNVEVVCTTDDPADSLEHHRRIAGDESFPVIVLPTFRADRSLAVDQRESWLTYITVLGQSANVEICSYADFLSAMRKRHDYFHHCGCRLSDHGLETVYTEEYTGSEIENIFGRLLASRRISAKDVLKFKSAVLYDLAVMDWEKEWVQQFHLGALRNNNSRMLRTIGPDTGFDSIGDFEIAKPLAGFLNRLDHDDELAKTILYNLNPRDNELITTMIGNFQDGSVPGKIQFGAAWWFLDQQNGIRRQIDALSAMGILSQFVGMLTDSRSFLSYPRHEYFRRILCNLLGEEMEQGLLPDDIGLVGKMVQDICYYNAKRYFNFHQIETAPSDTPGMPAISTERAGQDASS